MAKSFSSGMGTQIKSRLDLLDTQKSLLLLSDVEVLVGFPEDTTARISDELGAGSPDITNAALGYIHDNGAPEQNIPARPFMLPALEDIKPKLSDKLGQILRAVMVKNGGDTVVEQGMHQLGLIAQLAIQNKINEGIPPPLAESTLRNRARKGRKGAAAELASRAQGIAPSTALAKPLIDTGELRKSVSYAIRSRKKRK